jgi:hypothetical protein
MALKLSEEVQDNEILKSSIFKIAVPVSSVHTIKSALRGTRLQLLVLTLQCTEQRRRLLLSQ